MRNRVAERFFPTEFVEARAAAESKPLPAPPAPPSGAAAAIALLKAEAPAVPLVLAMRRPAAPQPPVARPAPSPAVTFFAHYTEDLRVGMEMRSSLQAIGGILFESDDALDTIIVNALAPILAQLNDAVKAQVA